VTAVLDLTLALPAIRTMVADAVAERLGPATAPTGTDAASWRERLWGGPPTIRMSARELAKALGCSARQVYRYAERGMPARRRDDVLVFVAGEVRDWLTRQERVVNAASLRRAG
jgi:hypothetical protein